MTFPSDNLRPLRGNETSASSCLLLFLPLSSSETFSPLLPVLRQIMREIQEHKIKIYEFPETDDEEENRLVKKIKVRASPGGSTHRVMSHALVRYDGVN